MAVSEVDLSKLMLTPNQEWENPSRSCKYSPGARNIMRMPGKHNVPSLKFNKCKNI